MRKIKLQKIVRNLLDKLRSRFGHLEIISPPQGIENARLILLLRTDILQKTVVGCPCLNTCQSFDGANIMKKQDVGQIALLASYVHGPCTSVHTCKSRFKITLGNIETLAWTLW